MGTTAMRAGSGRTLFIDEMLVEQAAAVAREAEQDSVLRMSLELPGGRRIEFADDLAQFLFGIVDDISQRHGVFVRTLPESLTTSVAAAELGISRPTLMKLIARGELPSQKVGSHTRVKRDDVAQFKIARERDIRAAAEALLLMDDDDRDG